jgi:hypothetical protein
LIDSQGQNSKVWLVDTLDLNLDDSPVFLLWVNYTESATGTNGFTSSYFNISIDAISTTSPSQPAPSTSNGGASSVSNSSTQSISEQSTALPDDATSVSGKIGLGVGLGLGMPLLILLGALTCLIARRSRKPPEPSWPPAAIPHYFYQEKPEHVTSYEIFEAPDASHMPGQPLHRSELEGTLPEARMAQH